MPKRTNSVAELPDVLHPMENLLKVMRVQCQKELNRDPVPQFSAQDIQCTTQWILSALAAMKEDLRRFSSDGLKDHTNASLELVAVQARKSCIDLNLLISDGKEAFGGQQALGMITLAQETQSQEIKRGLRDFSAFLTAFGVTELQEASLGPESQEQNTKIIAILAALQQPARWPVAKTKWPVTALQHPTNQLPQDDKFSEIYGRICPTPMTAAGQLNELAQMAEHFANVCKEDAAAHSQWMEDLEKKMQELKTFIEVLLDVPDVYRRFMLLHLGEISNFKRIKPWVREEEARAALKELECLRDAIVEERLLRRLSPSLRSA